MEVLKTNKLRFLLGKWTGCGQGKFPTIAPFSYRETLTFTVDGLNDLIHYEQKTWLTHNNTPSHWESGFIRPVANTENRFEISNVQDSGRVEVLQGELVTNGDLHTLHLKMKLIQNDPRMVSTERIFTIHNNELSYIVNMATVSTPAFQQHLQCVLTKEVR